MDLSDPDASRKRKHSAVDKSRRNSSAPVVDEADKARKDLESMLNKIRCLTITKYMLERSSEVTHCTQMGTRFAISLSCITERGDVLIRTTFFIQHLQESSYMFGLLNTLVVPALAYPEEVMQDLGLQCLGLICSLEKALAADNMDLFLTCAFAENASTLLHVLSVKVSTSIMTFSTPCVKLHMRVPSSHSCISSFSP